MIKEKIKKARQVIGMRNRIALAFMELAGDKSFQKLAEEAKLKLVKEVLVLGDEVARTLISEHGTNDPRRIASDLGVKISGEDRGFTRGSEYRKDKKQIIVYRDWHEKLLREVRSTELSDRLLKYVVAHELFRHLEHHQIGEIYKRYKFPAWKIGPYQKENQIKGLSNVAAQAFTQTLIGLEISPQVFDYLTYILYTNR